MTFSWDVKAWPHQARIAAWFEAILEMHWDFLMLWPHQVQTAASAPRCCSPFAKCINSALPRRGPRIALGVARPLDSCLTLKTWDQQVVQGSFTVPPAQLDFFFSGSFVSNWTFCPFFFLPYCGDWKRFVGVVSKINPVQMRDPCEAIYMWIQFWYSILGATRVIGETLPCTNITYIQTSKNYFLSPQCENDLHLQKKQKNTAKSNKKAPNIRIMYGGLYIFAIESRSRLQMRLMSLLITRGASLDEFRMNNDEGLNRIIEIPRQARRGFNGS